MLQGTSTGTGRGAPTAFALPVDLGEGKDQFKTTLGDTSEVAEFSDPGRGRWARQQQTVIVGISAVLVGIGIWQATGLVLNPIFISTPSLVAPAFWHLLVNGPLPGDFLRSLLEMVGGLAIATVVGVGVGMLMGRIRILERALEPWVAFGNATPTIALLPVMEIWFGFGETARVAFIMTIAVWPLIVNTHLGVRAVSGRLADLGTSFGMTGWQQIRHVYLPGTLAYIFVGARISLAVGAVGMILGGQEIGESGLGGLVTVAGSRVETAQVVSAILTTTVLALVLFWALRQFQARVFPWIAATSAGRREAR